MDTETTQSKSIWDTLLKLDKSCAPGIEDEYRCDVVLGPDNEKCVKLFLRNEDCYQRILCPQEWKEALYCLQNKPREQCVPQIEKSRTCKKSIFENLTSPSLSQHFELVANTNEKCELHLMRHINCVQQLDEFDQECLEREKIFSTCFYGSVTPSELWKKWRTCEKQHPVNADEECFEELESMRTASFKRADTLCKESGVPKHVVERIGGPEKTLKFLSSLVYSAHCGYHFKDYDPRLYMNKNQNN
eukprot:TRINITY_DN3585_c0_g1_i1.p2 TRINITY_DN3585_c0_g1~~TRINITY_DN3585_c0_g1_i1.p2  ORF type:complete len:246 (-),score=40.75 TRINITY_DN3585_c0_g1_i1:1950-2687(-)